MPEIRVKLNVETDPFASIVRLHSQGRVPRDLIHVTSPWELGALPKGMGSGKTSVSIAITLPDGRVVIAESSLLALTAAVQALNARYPDG